MRWRQILEEFSPELIYVTGSKNIVTGALSRLNKIYNLNKSSTYSINNKGKPTLESLSENFAVNKEYVLHPTSFKTIMKFQQKDKSLIERKSLKTIQLQNFMGQVRSILLSIKTGK